MADPLSITTSALALVGVVLKVSVTAIGMVDKTTGAHEAAREALRNLRRALQNLNKGTSNIQIILRILISDPKDKAVKKLLALPEGEVAVKELCESLESTRGLLAERAGQAQVETTGLEPLPQDRRSLAFVQAVFKHNFSPSNIEDAIIALKDFQFEVESCQQTTELAFQQVWRVYDIVKSRTLQRRSSVSTISSISTQIPESSTSPQATTSFRREIIDWLKRQDVASKSDFETPNSETQTGRSTEENTSALKTQPTPVSRGQDLSRNRIRDFFGLSRARQDYNRMEPEEDEGYKLIEPFPWTPPQPLSPTSLTNATISGHQVQPTIAQPGALYRRNAVTSSPIIPANYDWENSNVPSGKDKVSASYFQAPPPNPDSQTPSATLPLGVLQATTSEARWLDSYTLKHNQDGISPPSQPWPNKPSLAVPVERQRLELINDLDATPPTYGQLPGTSIQYENDLSGAESHNNDDDGVIHLEENDKRWALGFFGSLKERNREKEALDGLGRVIGFLAATASDDWELLSVPCEMVSASEGAAREAAKFLKLEFKYADPPAQLSAARLWAIMLFNSSDHFVVQTAGKKFMDGVFSVIIAPTTSPVVRERLVDVLAGAAFTFHGPGKEGFQSTWKRVRPPNTPEEGIPFNMDDPMFDGMPARRPDSDVHQPTSVGQESEHV